jgi:hypothetical protein
MNGGQIAYTDVAAGLGSGRPVVVVVAGSGRTADAIARARAGNGGDNRAVEIEASPLTTVADIGEAAWPPPRVGGRLAGRRRTRSLGACLTAGAGGPRKRSAPRVPTGEPRNEAAPGSGAASAGRVRWPSG